MAATYCLSINGVTWAASKNMLAIYNGSGSSKTVKVYRIWMLNNQTSNVTGGLAICNLIRFTGAYTGGTGITLIKNDLNSAAVPAQIVCAYAPTAITSLGVYKRFLRSTDEIAVSGQTLDEISAVNSLNKIWDSGYGDSDVQPITLAETEGIAIQTEATGTYVGNTDMFAELTIT